TSSTISGGAGMRRGKFGRSAVKYSIVGAGIVGMATALELKRLNPDADVQVFEKEVGVGRHQSTHNSGVLHAGLYYKPGSLKAKLATTGIRRMVAFCQENGVAHDICGKVVVATSPDEIPALKTLLDRGEQNGLRDLRWLSPDELKEVEPHAAGLAAVRVPEEGIVDYKAVCAAMHRKLEARGAQVSLEALVYGIRRDGSGWRLQTRKGDYAADFLINCGGLYSDRVAHMAGERLATRIVPFRGEYYKLRPEAERLVRNLIYPTPDAKFPFLGVHFTRMIHGGIEAGPNAVLAFAREGYTKWKLRPGELMNAVAFKGLWNFMRQHRLMAQDEIRRSFSKALFCASLQRLVPEVQIEDLAPGGAGVRAQAMSPDGTLVQDFQFVERSNALHVINAPSPAATASLAIGEYVARKALALQGAEPVAA
ncbi:MAG TPA: L-2-hydroxyglutarate oxidase, partial [Chthoniobacterales bacterium]|nr:L-2-hydroxyglutarate oxidase [Chthoniobacterales bacterium]